jgi:hypothetical protein
MSHGSVAVPYRWDQCTIPHGTGAGPTEEASLLLANPPQTALRGDAPRRYLPVRSGTLRDAVAAPVSVDLSRPTAQAIGFAMRTSMNDGFDRSGAVPVAVKLITVLDQNQ